MNSKEQLPATVKTNSRLPHKKQECYWQSHHRFEDEALSDAEMKELQLLNQEREVRNVNRIEALIELPQKHGAAIQTMMNELNN